jgi:hypothetical protein
MQRRGGLMAELYDATNDKLKSAIISELKKKTCYQGESHSNKEYYFDTEIREDGQIIVHNYEINHKSCTTRFDLLMSIDDSLDEIDFSIEDFMDVPLYSKSIVDRFTKGLKGKLVSYFRDSRFGFIDFDGRLSPHVHVRIGMMEIK